jgi:hypothetical protein
MENKTKRRRTENGKSNYLNIMIIKRNLDKE